MALTPQPYPLFYVEAVDGAVRGGRIIGWADADRDGGDPVRPVVLFQHLDQTSGGLGEVTLDGRRPYWVAEAHGWAVAEAERVAAEQRKAAVPGPGLGVEGLRQAWPAVAEAVAHVNGRLGVIVRGATITHLDGNQVTVVVASSDLAEMLRDEPEPLQEALHDVLGGGWQVIPTYPETAG